MSLDSHINVTLTVNNSGVTQQGFGTIAFVTYKTLWPEMSREYSRKSEAIADGFASDSPEVRFINSVMSQTPRPPTCKLLRGTRPTTISYTLAATPANNAVYRVDVDGEGVTPTEVSYTSDGTATQAEIHSELLTDLNAVVGSNYAASFPLVAHADFTFTVVVTNQLHAVAHGRQTGDGPERVSNTGGALPVGLVAGTDYWLIRLGPDDLSVATSLANALAGTAVAVTVGGTGTQTMLHQVTTASPHLGVKVVADAPGEWFTLAVLETSRLSIVQDHADPGIAADLDDVVAQDPDWYYLYTTGNSEALIKEAADWAEGTPFKLYLPDSCDSACENTVSGGGDVADDLQAFNYSRTGMTYHRKPAEMWPAGWLGRVAPLSVGLWSLAYKTVQGSSADKFTTQQLTNLDNKRCSYYKVEAGRSIGWEGMVGSRDFGFVDVRVGLDFILQLIQTRGFGLLVSLNKLSYTDEDIAAMAGTISGALDECASDAHKLIAKGIPGDPNDPQPSVRFPRVRDIDPSVRALRRVPDGDVFFRLQGAVHSVDVNVTVIF